MFFFFVLQLNKKMVKIQKRISAAGWSYPLVCQYPKIQYILLKPEMKLLVWYKTEMHMLGEPDQYIICSLYNKNMFFANSFDFDKTNQCIRFVAVFFPLESSSTCTILFSLCSMTQKSLSFLPPYLQIFDEGLYKHGSCTCINIT